MREDLHVHYSASLYDTYAQQGVEKFDLLTLARVLNEIRQRPRGGRILDIGTGTGVVAVKLASRPECAGWEVVGADYYNDMIELAIANRAQAKTHADLSFLCDDVHAMQFADGSFDIALARSNIHHWRDPVLAFRETFRVLRAGGVAIFHEPRKDSNSAALAEFNLARSKLGVEASRVEEKYSTAELRAFIDEAGLAAYTNVFAPTKGFAALGVEIMLRKPAGDFDTGSAATN